jgi:transposase
MLSFPAAIRVYLCTIPCDMRRSFDGLSMMAEHVIGGNPYAAHLLVFSNRTDGPSEDFVLGLGRMGDVV